VSASIDAVRGMRDVLPDDFQALTTVQRRLEATLNSFGYQPIDLPIVEHRSLYLRKLGEELVGKVYEFNYGGRELALRPEWTASVLRSYVDKLQDQALPLRLRYAGPVFRYERPQRATYRQFTQVGVELIGGPSPRADAEVIGLACSGLDELGIEDYQVRIAHIGLVRGILNHMGIPERIQGLLAWSLERMRSHGVETVREKLRRAHEGESFDPTILGNLDDRQATALLERLLGEINVNLNLGTRPPSDIVDRLLRKMRREDPQEKINRALQVLERLSQIRGEPEQALAAATQLLDEYQLPREALDEMRSILALLDAFQIRGSVLLDFGMGRGLQYYTGTIFEIYSADDLQLCGGGRYDDLIATLGARQSVPAVGCAYGLERLLDAMPNPPAQQEQQSVLVVAVEEQDYTYAIQVAQRLRKLGYTVSFDVRDRGVASSLREALRRNIRYLAVVGVEERNSQAVVWRDLSTREETRIALTALGAV
jgi:histidyl-tRNA synthetase